MAKNATTVSVYDSPAVTAAVGLQVSLRPPPGAMGFARGFPKFVAGEQIPLAVMPVSAMDPELVAVMARIPFPPLPEPGATRLPESSTWSVFWALLAVVVK